MVVASKCALKWKRNFAVTRVRRPAVAAHGDRLLAPHCHPVRQPLWSVPPVTYRRRRARPGSRETGAVFRGASHRPGRGDQPERTRRKAVSRKEP